MLNSVTPESVGFSAERLTRLDRGMQAWVDQGKLAGVVVLLSRGGKLFHRGCYGMADIARQRPMQSDTLFRLWSVTKAITAAAVLTLYEEGHYVLDQDISEFIPAFKDTLVAANADTAATIDDLQLVEKATPLTIRHLLTHSGGIAFGFYNPFPVDKILEKRFIEAGGDTVPLERIVEAIAGAPLVGQPGTCWKYGMGFEVLARLVEVVSGQPYGVFLRERLFEPLGMADAGFFVTDAQADRFSAFYAPNEDRTALKAIEDSTGSPNGQSDLADMPDAWGRGGYGLVATPEDILRFGHMLLNRGELDGQRILAPTTVDLMAANHLPANLLIPENKTGRPGYGHGLGVHVLMDRGVAGLPCANGEYWKDGGSGTLLWIDPTYDLTGVVMYQLDPFWIYPIFSQVRALAYQAMME